ncbi:MAG: type II toxin-antitoxin system RatA family toxin [Cellvibrionaceae bacterium]
MAKHIERSALVSFSAWQMYELVNDVEAYPRFLDGCVDAEILARGEHFMEARLDLKKGKLAKSFVTRNALVPGKRIELQLVEGPFKTLEGIWTFQPLGDAGCKVSLSMTFEFESKLVSLAADPWFESMANQLVSAMCERAREIYE